LGLTKRAIDAAEYGGDGNSQDVRYDDQLPGFGLRIYPSGTKSFVLRYRTKSGRLRFQTLGRYGVLTLKQARDEARAILGEVAQGGDPAAEKKSAAEELFFAEYSDLYLERHAKLRKKTWKEDERRIGKHLLPRWKSHALEEISRADVAKLHAEIGKDAPYEANRVLALVGVMFSLAEDWGFVPETHPNPTAKIRPFREKSRERYVKPAEMPALLEAISEEPSPYVRAIPWLYLLTGLRKSELLQAKWEDLDVERRELRIPETKAGRPHVVPLSEPAFEFLTSLPREQSNPYLFPGRKKGQPLSDITKPWRRVREKSGLEDIRLHDLRRTVGSWMAISGASLPLIGKVLNHSDPSTTAVYARLAENSARNALERHAENIMDVAGDAAPTDDGKD
jgi:integrase